VTPGPLALVGSGAFTASMRSVDTLLLADAASRTVLVVPAPAAADGPAAVTRVVVAAQQHFARLGAEVVVSGVRGRAAAERDRPQPDSVGLIYLAGGRVGHLARALVGTPYADALIAAWRGGAPLAAASAGAVLLGSRVYDPEDPCAPGLPGAGVLDAAVVPHWREVSRARPEFAARVRREQPRVLVLDEDTAAVHGEGAWMVAGRGGAMLGAGADLRPLEHDDLPPVRWPALI
jgi:cyanophycinase-like exopeptidase